MAKASHTKHDLNIASTEYIASIKGVSDELARNIVAFRDRIGGFADIDMLLEIDGVGPATLYKFREIFVVAQPDANAEPRQFQNLGSGSGARPAGISGGSAMLGLEDGPMPPNLATLMACYWMEQSQDYLQTVGEMALSRSLSDSYRSGTRFMGSSIARAVAANAYSVKALSKMAPMGR